MYVFNKHTLPTPPIFKGYFRLFMYDVCFFNYFSEQDKLLVGFNSLRNRLGWRKYARKNGIPRPFYYRMRRMPASLRLHYKTIHGWFFDCRCGNATLSIFVVFIQFDFVGFFLRRGFV